MRDHSMSDMEAENYLLYYIETEKELILKYASEKNTVIPKTSHNIEVLEEKLRNQTKNLSDSEKEFLSKHVFFLQLLKGINLGALSIGLTYVFYHDELFFDTLRQGLLTGVLLEGVTFLCLGISNVIDSFNDEWKMELEDILKYQLFYQNEECLKKYKETLTYNAIHKMRYKELRKELQQAKKVGAKSLKRVKTTKIEAR